ncbi:hypothetical protein HPO_19123 [Hyphomonas polymorpha PS728]|uniref:Cyclase n=1 Tax=Hyphomonas polymorpha PS728 TaxID=1280954 RepID=A0A062VEZ9_9PROT|nr:cyclase family protein [Hyphomonas polymorpha]KCZ96583.1 hypothetical protein HPO_19123 [Hyphomonas polymorpha PS728]
MNPRFKVRPPGSNWGDFGPNDQIGRLNLITSQKVLQGIAEVKEGLTFCLSLPLNRPGNQALAPSRKPPKVLPALVGRKQKPFLNFPMSLVVNGAIDVGSDDYATIYLQHSTQWDGFAHSGAWFDADDDGEPEIRYYNGYKGGEDVVVIEDRGDDTPNHGGALRLGIEHMAASCVQGRGVMIDLEKHFGRQRRAVGFKDLEQVMKADGVVVERGDIVCFRTGLAKLVWEGGDAPDPALLNSVCAGLDGHDDDLLDWISSSELAAIVSDNFAVELHVVGEEKLSVDCCVSPLHRHCLFKLGIPLGELWYLSELADWLAANNRTRFMLTAPPLRLPGALGSPLTPVATV